MSFFKCKKCSHPLSGEALSCSNCGDPDPLYNNERMELIKKQNKVDSKLRYITFVFGFFLIMLVIGLIALPSGAKIVGVPFQLVIMVVCVPFFIKYKKESDLLGKKFDEIIKNFYSLRIN
jgi:hypothetical protein